MLFVPCRSVDYSGLPPVLNNWTTSGPGVNASSSTLMDVWEVPLYTEQWFTTRTRAFFRAPVTGPHTFSVVADDFAQLTASWLQVGCLVLGRSGEGCCIQVQVSCATDLEPTACAPCSRMCQKERWVPFPTCANSRLCKYLCRRVACWLAGSW